MEETAVEVYARETDRQTDRQTDSQTDRQTDRQTVRGGWGGVGGERDRVLNV